MAILIVGDNCTRNAQHDADVFASFVGDEVVISQLYGDQMAATVVDNNTVRIASGICCCEGRPIKIADGNYDDFAIPTGSAGVTVTYYLGYKITSGTDGDTIEQVVSTEKTEQGSIRAGDTEMYVWLYSVVLNEINLGTPTLLVNTYDPFVDTVPETICKAFTKVCYPAGKDEFQYMTLDKLSEKFGETITASMLKTQFGFTAINGDYSANNKAYVVGIKLKDTGVYLVMNGAYTTGIRINVTATYQKSGAITV